MEAKAMLADTKKYIDSLVNLKLVGVMLAAVVLSILALLIMYALGYPTMLLGEAYLIWATLMHVLLAVWSAVKAILYGIVVFGLLLVFLSPVLIVLRELRKKQNPPSHASSLAASSSTAVETRP